MLKKIVIFDLIILLGFAFILYWIGSVRFNDFYESQNSIAIETTNIIHREIEKQLEQKKLLVTIFLEDHITLVSKLADSPGNEKLFTELNAKLKRYFPDFFSANIATEHGIPIIDDFEGNLGQLCIEDMRHFSKGKAQIIRIHPNPNIYHYDILIPFSSKKKDFIFFVSFKPDDISSLLLTSQSTSHILMLIQKDRENLIEILDSGARDSLTTRLDYRLTQEEITRILASAPVKGSQWSVIDLHEPLLFSNYQKSIINESAIIFIIFSIIVFILTGFLYMGDRKRALAEAQLAQKNDYITKLNTKLSLANESLEKLSITDPLTGLFNRRYLDSKLAEERDRARRLNLSVVFALIDVDYFKQYNDVYGHQAGDECLKIVANVLSLTFRRAGDFVARYGGEEFAIVTMVDSYKSAPSQIKKFIKSIEACNIEHKGSKIANNLTISAGVSYLLPDSSYTLTDLVQNADKALYTAKANGRNQVVDYYPIEDT